jgi:hypothetical protein
MRTVARADDRKKLRRTFPTEAEARSWQADAKRAIDLGTLRTPTRRTLAETATAWLDGVEAGEIRNRSPFSKDCRLASR